MSTQIAGFTTANIMEVETNTKAARTTLKPIDIGSLGSYTLASTNGSSVMAAGLAAASPIFAFRYPGASLALVRRVMFSAGNGVTAFTAGFFRFDCLVARSYSVSDTGGTDITPSGNVNKNRTSHASSGVTGTRCVAISATATLTAGTRTTDAVPIGTIAGGVPNVAGSAMVAKTALFDAPPGTWPLVLATNEGFVIQATVPATGVWEFGVDVSWDEVASYP